MLPAFVLLLLLFYTSRPPPPPFIAPLMDGERCCFIFSFFFVLLVVHRVGSSLIFFFSFLSRPTFSFLALVVTFLLYSSVRLSDDRQADAQTSESVARGVSLWGIGPVASRRVEALQLVTTDSLRLFQRVARPRLPDLLPCHATVA